MAERKKLAIIDGKSVFYPDTKLSMFRNLIADYFTSGFGMGQAVAGNTYVR